MAEDKKLYLVHSTLDHDKRYENGDEVHLSDDDAAPLLKAGVVSLAENDNTPETDDVPLTTLKVSELKELATKLNITLAGNATKDAIIAAIAEARAAQQ